MPNEKTKPQAISLEPQDGYSILRLGPDPARVIRSEICSAAKARPKEFERSPILLDVSGARRINHAIDFVELRSAAEETGIRIVGVTGGTAHQHAEADKTGFRIVTTDEDISAALGDIAPPAAKPARQRKEKAAADPAPAAAPAATPVAAPAAPASAPAPAAEVPAAPAGETPASGLPPKIHRGIVRSGMLVRADGCDLVVIGSVSPGGVVVADGSIIIVGPLSGKAYAGAGGDENRWITADSMDAEIVCIAGTYLSADDFPEESQKKRALCHLDGEIIRVVHL